MISAFHSAILNATGASAYTETEQVQELWSGYGQIVRIALTGAAQSSAIVKHVQLPKAAQHPRGWNTDLGHQRKLQSYRVETAWYRHFSRRSAARVPECFAVEAKTDEVMILLEDLDAAGFPVRKTRVDWADVVACLTWLARFHAGFLDHDPEGLWPVGTYWHLATRPQELEALDDEALKAAAPAIDAQLNGCRYKTFVHGDAKLANFCFSPEGQNAPEVAAVDFQYVGGGCGMKDVAYFIGSCLDEADCERLEAKILDAYFDALHTALGHRHEALEAEWRALYPVAWVDFHRFLKGWSPGHWKINSYSERVTAAVIDRL